MQLPQFNDARGEALKQAAADLETHARSALDLRRKMSSVPPDELSQLDLLAMRAGMIRNLETHEKVSAALVRLLNKIADTL